MVAILLAMLAHSAVVRPPVMLDDFDRLFATARYPEEAQSNHWGGQTRVRLTIGADGRVHGCTVVQSSGHAVLDQKTCEVLRTAHFAPARDRKGRPVQGTLLSELVSWTAP